MQRYAVTSEASTRLTDRDACAEVDDGAADSGGRDQGEKAGDNREASSLRLRKAYQAADRSTRQHRPAMVVSQGGIGQDKALLWMVMITSAGNRPWHG